MTNVGPTEERTGQGLTPPGPLPRNWEISGGFWGAGSRPRGEAGLRRTPRLWGCLYRAAREPMGGGADRGAGGRSREPSGAKGPSAWQPPTPPPQAALPGEERTPQPTRPSEVDRRLPGFGMDVSDGGEDDDPKIARPTTRVPAGQFRAPHSAGPWPGQGGPRERPLGQGPSAHRAVQVRLRAPCRLSARAPRQPRANFPAATLGGGGGSGGGGGGGGSGAGAEGGELQARVRARVPVLSTHRGDNGDARTPPRGAPLQIPNLRPRCADPHLSDPGRQTAVPARLEPRVDSEGV